MMVLLLLIPCVDCRFVLTSSALDGRRQRSERLMFDFDLLAIVQIGRAAYDDAISRRHARQNLRLRSVARSDLHSVPLDAVVVQHEHELLAAFVAHRVLWNEYARRRFSCFLLF